VYQFWNEFCISEIALFIADLSFLTIFNIKIFLKKSRKKLAVLKIFFCSFNHDNLIFIMKILDTR